MRIVLLGGGGHASDVLGAIEAAIVGLAAAGTQISVAGILADNEVDRKRFADRNVSQIGSIEDLKSVDASHYIVCLGYPEDRKHVATRAKTSDKKAATIVHPRAWMPAGTVVGEGTIVLAGVCISPGVALGNHVYLSHGCLVGHDCRVSDYVSLMPGASVSGDTFLGEGCLIGANATVLEKLSIGAWATLGAGAVAVKDIPSGVVAKGIPAKY